MQAEGRAPAASAAGWAAAWNGGAVAPMTQPTALERTAAQAPADPSAEADRLAAQSVAAAAHSQHRRGGSTTATVDLDAVAADVVHTARAGTADAVAMMEAARARLAEHGPALDDAVANPIATEMHADATLLGGEAHAAADPEAVRSRTDAIEAANTTRHSARYRTLPETFNVDAAAYDVEELARENPSLAVEVRRELAGRVRAAEAADLNRILAGKATWGENVAVAFADPVDGAIGAGKGFVNGISDLVELTGRGLNHADAGMSWLSARTADALGFDETAARHDADAARFRKQARALDVPEFALDGRAQQGGETIGIAVDVALGVKALATGGARLAARNADEVARLADDVPLPGARGVAGRRLSPGTVVDEPTIERLRQEFAEVGGDPSILRLNEGRRTAFDDDMDVIGGLERSSRRGHLGWRGDERPAPRRGFSIRASCAACRRARRRRPRVRRARAG